MSPRKRERRCEACGQPFVPSAAHARTCSPACQQHLRRTLSADSTRLRDRPFPAAGAQAADPWTGRTLYSVPRTPPFLVVGRPVLAETSRLVFTSSSALGEWDTGARQASVFEKTQLEASGSAGLFADFGTVFLRLEDAQAHAERRIADEQAREAREARRQRERLRQREQQRQREERWRSRQQRGRERQGSGPSGAQQHECFRLLGLTWPCSVEEVKAAFRKLVHKHHPDKGGSSVAFIALREAYHEAVNRCLDERRA
jgi:hypothetical protein